MRSLLFLSIICLFGCSKSNTESRPNPAPSGGVYFKANGIEVSFAALNLSSGEYSTFSKQLSGITARTRYLLNAQKGSDNIFVATLVTDSLTTGQLHYDSTVIASLGGIGVGMFTSLVGGKQSTLNFSTDYIDFNITSYQNGKISGTFSGKLSPLTGTGVFGVPGSVSITDGALNNVQVIY